MPKLAGLVKKRKWILWSCNAPFILDVMLFFAKGKVFGQRKIDGLPIIYPIWTTLLEWVEMLSLRVVRIAKDSWKRK